MQATQTTAIAPPLLDYRCLRLHLRTLTPWSLVSYKGSPWRGAFGHQLKKMVCPFQRAECESCLLRQQCFYIRLFETPRESGQNIPGGTTYLPHPLILSPPLDGREEIPADTLLSADFTLLSPAFDALPYILLAFINMGKKGLGKAQGEFALENMQVRCGADWETLYDDNTQQLGRLPQNHALVLPTQTQQLRLHSLSPLRLKQQGKLLKSLDFASLMQSIIRRVTHLSQLYQSNETGQTAPKLSGVENIETHHSEWQNFSMIRYSNRKKTLMKLEGISGSASFSGDLSPFVPWLQLAEALHIGNLTSFGFGKFGLEWGEG